MENNTLDDINSLQCPVISVRSNHCWEKTYHDHRWLIKKCDQCGSQDINIESCRKCEHCGLTAMEIQTPAKTHFQIIK